MSRIPRLRIAAGFSAASSQPAAAMTNLTSAPTEASKSADASTGMWWKKLALVGSVLGFITVAASTDSARAQCLEPRGDINASGSTSVVDVQCEVLITLWEFSGQVGPEPTCLAVTLQQADMNCDGSINVSDIQLTVRHALNINLPLALDTDQNGCVDICELDSDGDGDGDFLDCSPYSADIGSANPEVCNGIDDNCNGLVDEDTEATVGASCQNGDLCDGQEVCLGQPDGLGLMINEIMVNPAAVADSTGEWFEVYNPTTQQIDMNGWQIQDNVGTHLINNQGPLRVPPGGYIVLGKSLDPAQNGGFNIQYAYIGIDLANTSDLLRLRNPAGVLVDEVVYSAVTFPIQSGASMALTNPALNNNVGSSWAASTAHLIGTAGADAGTPKSANVDVLNVATCTDGPDLVCNDGINCTIDSCDGALGCLVVGDDAVCDDGVGCTADSCDTATGCVNAPDDGECDDEVGCTLDACDVVADCQNIAEDTACDDGIGCTLDICDELADCANLEDDSACDDGVACTLDICDAEDDCANLTDDSACDDGVFCTLDICDSLTDCANLPDDAACDDGSNCTDDICDELSDCQAIPNDGACDDGVNCTLDICDGANDCVNLTDDDLCNDGIACTSDTCDAIAGCQVTADDNECDDGVACTLDICDEATGCASLADDSACDDGDPCTTDACSDTLGCTYQPVNTPECQVQLEGNQFCAASGTSGSTVICTLRLSHYNQATPFATALSLGIAYDPLVVSPVRFLADVCTGPGGTPPCSTVEAPPNTLGTGHNLFPAPGDLSTWNGLGNAFLLHLSDPTTAITQAYQQGGLPVGETVFAKLEVELLADVDTATPSYLEYTDITGSTSDVKPLVGAVDQGLIIASVGQCADFPGICDDSNACTTDVCDAASGSCSNAPVDCSDGNACNGMETCNPASGCLGGAALDCDDNEPCTTDSCDPAAGCVYEGDDGACDDGVACTDDACVPGQGCVNTASDGNCDDGVACTIDACDALLGCSNTTSDAACDDGFACTSEVCDALLDCEYTTDDSQCAGDDGNPCTEAACVVGAGCSNVVIPDVECLPDGALCALSGTSGDTVTCPVRVARATTGTPEPSALQFALSYDDAMLTILGSEDGGVPTPPSTLDPSGHTIQPVPADYATWTGAGTMFAYNLSDPGASLTDAYLAAGGTFVGDTQIYEFQFQLDGDIDSASPMYVMASDIVGGSAVVAPLVGYVQAGTMVLATADCDDFAGACDDGDPCTIDSCDPATGGCSYESIECSDGDACNGIETCLPLIGCQPGAAPVCDDNQACSTDSCDPIAGCQYELNDAACDDGVGCTADSCAAFDGCINAPVDVDCNDGVLCTLDVCDATLGCSNTADDGLCDDGAACSTGTCNATAGCEFAFDDSGCEDDGNPCTADECVLGVGCAHTPLATAECLEPGVLCLVSGAAGEEVICPLRLARDTQSTPMPAALQLGLSWDAASASAVSFQATVCLGGPGTCVDVDTPTNTTATGHTVAPAPGDVTTWNGAGTVFYLHTSAPATALSQAYASGGSIVGEPEFAGLRLQLLVTVDPGAPLAIYADQVEASTADVAQMTGTVSGGVMLVALADCTEWPAACDDDNACSDDLCNAGSGECTHVATTCADGNACNGDETCVSWLGCALGAPPVCDDGQACTSDSCAPATGCQYDADNAACDDGEPCTIDSCSAFGGCENAPDDSLCDDGVACTTDACNDLTGCSNTQADAVCDDGLACTTDTCDAADGCLYGEVDSACDDGDACTIDSCVAGMGCVHVVDSDPTCLPAGALCAISGLAGDSVVCPLRLARATDATPSATGLSLQLELIGDGASVTALRDELCFGPGNCMMVDVPPSTLAPSGHSVAINPPDVAAWQNTGELLVFHSGDPTAAITEAYRSAGALQGDAVFAELVVQLNEDVSGYDPIILVPHDVEGATSFVTLLTGDVWQGTILMATTGCNTDPSVCDDDNACTTDTCNTGTGHCEYSAAVTCDNGNACDGIETCNPADGACIPGQALVCDDEIDCTIDACDSTAGCTYEADHSACADDGDACTTELCYPASGGCLSAPDISGDCLPGNAICAMYGQAGGMSTCRVRLARAADVDPAATALQFGIVYNNSFAWFAGATDEVCVGPVCMDVPVPPGMLSPTGHSVALAPSAPAAWSGAGSVFVFHASAVGAGITDAYYSAGMLQGSADFLDLQFTMKQSVSPLAPGYVYASDIVGTSNGSDTLGGMVMDGVLVTAP